VYLSEDIFGGGLYRFTPEAYPDLSAGTLDIACDGGAGRVIWKPVPDPSGAAGPTRDQVPGKLPFARGEGIWFDGGVVYLATTTDETIHAYDTRTRTIEILYRAADVENAPLRGVDNVHVSRSGDIFVGEDSYSNDPDAMDVCLITPDREVSRFLKLTGPEHFLPQFQSETVGIAFDPSGKRMYFGSQRGGGVGIVYEITGPFRASRRVDPAPGVPIGLAVAKRFDLRRFLRKGMPIAVTLDEAATLTVRLTVKAGRRTVTLVRTRRRFDRGARSLSLEPGKAARKRLRRRRGAVRAQLEVRIATPGAPDRVMRRTIHLQRTRR
jgi:hypothetical protein